MIPLNPGGGHIVCWVMFNDLRARIFVLEEFN
jgi:hypothetical protein